MARFRSSIDVPLPVDETLAFAADLRHAPAWDPQASRAVKITPGPVAAGTRFVLETGLFGRGLKLPYEIVRFEPGRRVTFAGRTRILRYRDEITLRPLEDQSRLTYDAELSFRGPLRLGNLFLRPVLQRVGGDALAGMEEALRVLATAGPVPQTAEAETVTPNIVREIAAIQDPALRNLRITHAYHLLSRALTRRLGSDDVNWCTFATWASKTAGRFIREEDVHHRLRRILERKSRLRRLLRGDPDALHPFLEVTAEISRFIREGNRAVFEELGGLYAEFLETFADDEEPRQDRLEAFVARLRPGPSEPDEVTQTEGGRGEIVARLRGGQDLLGDAMRSYWEALYEDDPDRRSEKILRGSALAGLHEQTRLQGYIAGALQSPVDELVYSRHNDALKERLTRRLLGRAQERFHRAFRPLGEEILETMREMSTAWLMEMDVPGEVLWLGEDLPVPRDGRTFPASLERLEDPDLIRVLTDHDALEPRLRAQGFFARIRAGFLRLLGKLRPGRVTIPGTAARDWADLNERIRYIFFLFRSRQQDPVLAEPPFSEAQTSALLAGRMPPGAL